MPRKIAVSVVMSGKTARKDETHGSSSVSSNATPHKLAKSVAMRDKIGAS